MAPTRVEKFYDLIDELNILIDEKMHDKGRFSEAAIDGLQQAIHFLGDPKDPDGLVTMTLNTKNEKRDYALLLYLREVDRIRDEALNGPLKYFPMPEPELIRKAVEEQGQ